MPRGISGIRISDSSQNSHLSKLNICLFHIHDADYTVSNFTNEERCIQRERKRKRDQYPKSFPK